MREDDDEFGESARCEFRKSFKVGCGEWWLEGEIRGGEDGEGRGDDCCFGLGDE